MYRLNRSLLILAVAGGLFGGPGCVQTEPPPPRVVVLHSHMQHALLRLREARHELEGSEDIFRHHREEAIEHVDRAIRHVVEGLREQGDQIAAPGEWHSAGAEGERFPHLRRTRERLREAREDLEAADRVFGGHRERAIEQTELAIRQVEEGIHDAER